MRGLRGWNIAVGLLHVAQGVLILVLANGASLPVTSSYMTGPPASGLRSGEGVLFNLPFGPAVAAFLFLAAADHLLMAAPRVRNWYETNLRRGVNYARWIEYSISASIMVVLIAMLTGISEIAADMLEAEIAELVEQVAPQLLDEPGFGALTTAKLLGEIAGAGRFATEAKLARAAGVAPIPVSSGKTNRHRLDRGGNRQLNTAIHRIALTRARCHPETRNYLARKRADGKTGLTAMRCLKRHLARRIWHLLQPPPSTAMTTIS